MFLAPTTSVEELASTKTLVLLNFFVLLLVLDRILVDLFFFEFYFKNLVIHILFLYVHVWEHSTNVHSFIP